MRHDTYTNAPAHARQAVLMIHGICGTPRHFDFLLEAFDQSWAVYNILLDGHGGSVRDFAHTSMKKWQDQTRTMLDSLSDSYDRILVIGHSMGCLLLLQSLPHYPKICGCVLLNVPMYPRLHPRLIPRLLRLSFGKSRPEDPDDRFLLRASSITVTKNLFLYLGWIPRFWELLQLCRRCRNSFSLSVPALVFLGDKDELVALRSKKFFQYEDHIRLRILENIGHFGFPPDAANAVLADLTDFLSQLGQKPVSGNKLYGPVR